MAKNIVDFEGNKKSSYLQGYNLLFYIKNWVETNCASAAQQSIHFAFKVKLLIKTVLNVNSSSLNNRIKNYNLIHEPWVGLSFKYTK